MKKISIYSILALLLIAVVGLYVSKNNANRVFTKTNDEIREEIMMLTPVGIHIEDVAKAIEENDIFEWDGFINQEIGYIADEFGENVVGVKSVKAVIKEKSFPCII